MSQICHIFLILPQFWFSTFFWFLTPTIFYASIHFYAFRTAIIFSRYLLYHWMYQREIKRCLLLGRRTRTNLDSILKNRDITWLTKVHLVKAMVFPVVMYGYELDYKESWVPKTDASELWCWRRLLRVPWTARRSNPFILKEISPEYSLEGLMLKLKLQYFGHLMQRTDSFEKTLMLGKIEGGRQRGDRGWDGWMASPTQWTWVWVNSRSR